MNTSNLSGGSNAEPKRKRSYNNHNSHNKGHINMTEQLAEIKRDLRNVAMQCEQNTHRIEANEVNSRALNVIFKHFPKFDAERKYIEPRDHLRRMLTEAYEFDKEVCDAVLSDACKIHYLFSKDNKDCSFIARFLRQDCKDLIMKNASKLSNYEPHGMVISVEHDLTTKQRKLKTLLLVAAGVLKSQKKDAKVIFGGNVGYVLMLHGVKYTADSEVVRKILKENPQKPKEKSTPVASTSDATPVAPAPDMS
ncbi:hypothetical protein AAVH_15211 [Aphelenchoides avenae]|nr:hypothetical protein AAVH_15211 [Aphelenchus avenae]